MVTLEGSRKLAMGSGVRPEDFNRVQGVPNEWFRFWALLEVSKVARENYMEEEKLQREKDKKERIISRTTGLMNEESIKCTGKRKRGEDPEWVLEMGALTELEDAEDGDREWISEMRTSCLELEEAQRLGFAGASMSRKKRSRIDEGNQKANEKCLTKDDDWNSSARACSGIEFAEGSLWSSFSTKKGQSRKKKSENKVTKKSAKDREDQPDMPRELNDHIARALGGKEVRLVIQKHLTRSDVSGALCRVSIPMNQIIDSEFLREDEKTLLKASVDTDVRVLCSRSGEEDLGERVLKLRLWVMNKKPKGQRAARGEGKEPLETRAGGEEEARSLKKKGESEGMDGGEGPRPSYMYILRSGWPQFVRDNKLKLDDLVQIWSFRVESDLARDELRLAFVVLPGKQARESLGSQALID